MLWEVFREMSNHVWNTETGRGMTPTYLLKRNHGIIFSKDEQRGVLKVVHIFRVPDNAWRMRTGT